MVLLNSTTVLATTHVHLVAFISVCFLIYDGSLQRVGNMSTLKIFCQNRHIQTHHWTFANNYHNNTKTTAVTVLQIHSTVSTFASKTFIILSTQSSVSTAKQWVMWIIPHKSSNKYNPYYLTYHLVIGDTHTNIVLNWLNFPLPKSKLL